MVKVAATLDLGGFDTIIGFGTVAGTIGKAAGASSMDMQWVFGQMQGDLGDMSLGIYGDWAHAKGKAAGNILGAQDSMHFTGATVAATGVTNLALGAGQGATLMSGDKFDAFSIRASLEPMSQVTVALGYGYRKTTGVGNNIKHQVFSVGLGYSIYQNMIVSLAYTNDKLSLGTDASTVLNAANLGAVVGNTKTTTLDYVIYL